MTMRCDEIMKRDIECVGLDDTVKDAARKMRDEEIGFLPVCDESNKPIGTLTDRDIAIRVVAEDKPSTTKINDIMTSPPVACRASDDLLEAVRLMREHQKSRIMCTDDNGQIVGVISLSDIVEVTKAVGADALRDVSARERHQ
jgi:CBS domain-containing protein